MALRTYCIPVVACDSDRLSNLVDYQIW